MSLFRPIMANGYESGIALIAVAGHGPIRATQKVELYPLCQHLIFRCYLVCKFDGKGRKTSDNNHMLLEYFKHWALRCTSCLQPNCVLLTATKKSWQQACGYQSTEAALFVT